MGTEAEGFTETITREEVAAFCVRHKDYGVPTADAIWDDIKAHREPEYEPGGIYQDAIGQPFYRRPEGGWLWLPGGKPFSDHTPNRPLRKLVPEGTQNAVEPDALQWGSFWGGQDPDDCAGSLMHGGDDQAAHEDAQWRITGGVAYRTVTYGPWKVWSGTDD